LYLSSAPLASVDVTMSASAKDRSEILQPALHRFTSIGDKDMKVTYQSCASREGAFYDIFCGSATILVKLRLVTELVG